jgi:hypothetical protein
MQAGDTDASPPRPGILNRARELAKGIGGAMGSHSSSHMPSASSSASSMLAGNVFAAGQRFVPMDLDPAGGGIRGDMAAGSGIRLGGQHVRGHSRSHSLGQSQGTSMSLHPHPMQSTLKRPHSQLELSQDDPQNHQSMARGGTGGRVAKFRPQTQHQHQQRGLQATTTTTATGSMCLPTGAAGTSASSPDDLDRALADPGGGAGDSTASATGSSARGGGHSGSGAALKPQTRTRATVPAAAGAATSTTTTTTTTNTSSHSAHSSHSSTGSSTSLSHRRQLSFTTDSTESTGTSASASTSTSGSGNVGNISHIGSLHHNGSQPTGPSSASLLGASAAAAAQQSLERNTILRTSSSSSNTSTSTLSSSLSTDTAATSASSTTAASAASTAIASSVSHHAPASAMPVDDEPVLSFWGPDPVPLPSRFARIKRNLIAGHEAALEASWARLIHALRAEVEHIEGLGAHLIPSIEFADIEDSAQTERFGRDLRRYGVGVVRRAVPKADADDMVRGTVKYLATRQGADVKAPLQDPTCFDFFWTPAQVLARAHPSVLRAQRFMMGLWETSPDDRLATRLPITYADRIRIHGTTTGAAESEDGEEPLEGSGGLPIPPVAPNAGDLQAPGQNPQSADDWITALQSSAGIIAQVDNGSLERWEPDGYGRTGTYSRVYQGDWESYDPWECASRVSSTMDLYNGYGCCTIFRMFQGMLTLSTIEPGMIRLLPSPRLATAYYLLRPFFSPRTPMPAIRSGPEWEAYLDPSNWRLERDPDTIIHGAVPGHAQRITEHWHPHLNLRGSMITLPTLQPGDYIFWHPDLPYHISSQSHGLQTPRRAPGDVSMLVYIPAAPLTQTNALYLARQRKAFQRGHPGPDFDSNGRNTMAEDPEVRPGEKEIADIGGPAALQAMGLAPWEAAATRAPTPPGSDKEKSAANADKDKSKKREKKKEAKGDESGSEKEPKKQKTLTHQLKAKVSMVAAAAATGGEPDPETKSITSAVSSSGSHAEAELVRLSNIILFPDRSMMGYSV